MDFRKIFFGFVFLIFGNWGFGQGDTTQVGLLLNDSLSTDIVLDSNTSHLLADTTGSENAVVGGFHLVYKKANNGSESENISDELIVHFVITDTTLIEFVQIELAVVTSDGITVVEFHKFQMDEFFEVAVVNGNSFKYSINSVQSDLNYRVTILIINEDGTEFPVLSKAHKSQI